MKTATAEQKFFWLPATDYAVERRHERFPVRIPARISRSDGFQRVTIANISRGGMLLAGTFGLFSGDAITIELINGRQIAARIVWSTGSRCGACLLELLAETDPLLAGRLSQRIEPEISVL